MLNKTISGFILGLLLSASIVLNFNLLLPFDVDTLLLFGLLVAFPIWAAIQIYFYALPSTKKAIIRCGIALAPSILLNVLLLSTR